MRLLSGNLQRGEQRSCRWGCGIVDGVKKVVACIAAVCLPFLFTAAAEGTPRFSDVPADAFYAYPVEWLLANNITNGTSPTTFSPDRFVTRGEMAAFLWRAAGRPVAATACGFVDVPQRIFYAQATCWLVSAGITNGTSPTTFSPDRFVTRGEMAAFLWRAAGRPDTAAPHHFSDITSDKYYEVAVRWLRASGVSVGVGSPYRYSPANPVTRAQMAAFLWRSAFPGEARVVLSTLKIASEDRTGYDRDAVFPGWRDLDRDGCNTRCEVLADEKRFDLPDLPSGGWFSVYDNVTTSNSSSFDIDHVIPMAEAWDSGGNVWSTERWTAFGNDLGDSRSLRAVSASSNRSKGDSDPGAWLPPYSGFRCQYAAEWVAVKSRWSLTVDPAEHAALTATLSSCAPHPVAAVAAAPQEQP